MIDKGTILVIEAIIKYGGIAEVKIENDKIVVVSITRKIASRESISKSISE